MSDIAGVTDFSEATTLGSTTAAASGSEELSKEAFLTLLTTQMQNQDPLNPMSNEDFIAQLAQFSSLEQQMLTNSMLESVYVGIASLNNASMAALVGAEVVAVGDGISYGGEGDVDLNYDAAADVSEASVSIYDSEGNLVFSEDIGALSAGEGRWTWDGTDSDGNPVEAGEYTFSITGEDADGESVEITELIAGTVEEMDYSSGTPQPSVDGVKVELADILRLTTADGEEGDAERERSGAEDSSADAT